MQFMEVENWPEWMRKRPRGEVILDIKIEDIPEGPSCVCGTKTVKALVDYTCGDKFIAFANNAPGYKCPKDSLEFYARETLIKFFLEAEIILRKNGDEDAAKTVHAALVNEQTE